MNDLTTVIVPLERQEQFERLLASLNVKAKKWGLDEIIVASTSPTVYVSETLPRQLAQLALATPTPSPLSSRTPTCSCHAGETAGRYRSPCTRKSTPRWRFSSHLASPSSTLAPRLVEIPHAR